MPAADVDFAHLDSIARLLRYYSLSASARAGSGHPTSSLSAADLMAGLLFGGAFRYDLEQPDHPNNDRLIFSKGHASPLFYGLWAVAGKVTEEELRGYRQFGSVFEGHPTPRFAYAEAATGSLGQGLSIGVGMALNAKHLDHLSHRTYVLLGDSEMAEGSQWEAMQIAAHYKLDNLVGIIDVNRLGQRGATMVGHDIDVYARRAEAFGWRAIMIDGHAMQEIVDAYNEAANHSDGRPVIIVARTIKGKGVSFLEDADNWHGKAVEPEQFKDAAHELGPVDKTLRGRIAMPEDLKPPSRPAKSVEPPHYDHGDKVATRKAYGTALKRIARGYPEIVSLDGEVSNSTNAQTFKKKEPERFFEMFIAEQNMVGTALGLAQRGKIPFVSTFAAFLTRAFDQIRMAQYSSANIKFVGSHAGVSIGEDGPSQMGLEDIAMFRSILDSVVLHPCDAVGTEKLVEAAAAHDGIVYLRTLRQNTPVIYDNEETFEIGGSHMLRAGDQDVATIIAAGSTVSEALSAYDELKKEGLSVRVIDAYSIKPIDAPTLREAAKATHHFIVVEDHYPAGGLGEAVLSALADRPVPMTHLAVTKRPLSGTGEELRDYADISARAIAAAVRTHQNRGRRTEAALTGD